nr:hypothetical protein [Tanacetum cinerariifolium]
MIRDSNVPSWIGCPHGQSLGVLPSLSAASGSGFHVTAAVSGSMYSATVAEPGVSEVDGQSLGVLPSLSAASGSGFHVTAAVSGSMYSATVAEPGVSEVGTPMHILAHGGFEAHDVLSGLTLPIKPKPLGQHRPPPP